MIIKIKEWDEMVEEYGVDVYGDEEIILTTEPFTRDMEYLCGRTFDTNSLEAYDDDGYLIASGAITPDMYKVIENNMKLGELLKKIDSSNICITIYDGNLDFGRHLVTYRGDGSQLSDEAQRRNVLKIHHSNNSIIIATEEEK